MSAAIGVLALASALAPPAPDSVPVVVAARSLEPGRTLLADDLTVADYPAALAPRAAVAGPGALVGRVLVAGLSPGTPIDAGVLVGESAKRADEVLVPIRFPDADLVALIRVGSVISVYAAQPGGGSRLVAARVRVAAVPQPRSDALTGGQSGAVVVVAASAGQAESLAGLSPGSQLGFAVA